MEVSTVISICATALMGLLGWFVRTLDKRLDKIEETTKERIQSTEDELENEDKNLSNQIADLKERLLNNKSELSSEIVATKKEIRGDIERFFGTLSEEVEKRRQADIDIYKDLEAIRTMIAQSSKEDGDKRFEIYRELINKIQELAIKVEQK